MSEVWTYGRTYGTNDEPIRSGIFIEKRTVGAGVTYDVSPLGSYTIFNPGTVNYDGCLWTDIQMCADSGSSSAWVAASWVNETDGDSDIFNNYRTHGFTNDSNTSCILSNLLGSTSPNTPKIFKPNSGNVRSSSGICSHPVGGKAYVLLGINDDSHAGCLYILQINNLTDILASCKIVLVGSNSDFGNFFYQKGPKSIIVEDNVVIAVSMVETSSEWKCMVFGFSTDLTKILWSRTIRSNVSTLLDLVPDREVAIQIFGDSNGYFYLLAPIKRTSDDQTPSVSLLVKFQAKDGNVMWQRKFVSSKRYINTDPLINKTETTRVCLNNGEADSSRIHLVGFFHAYYMDYDCYKNLVPVSTSKGQGMFYLALPADGFISEYGVIPVEVDTKMPSDRFELNYYVGDFNIVDGSGSLNFYNNIRPYTLTTVSYNTTTHGQWYAGTTQSSIPKNTNVQNI